jgi:DDE superfamily endonuclease
VLPAEQVTRPGLARRREQWRRYQGTIDPARLVFLDETWVKTNMAPLRGWGDRSKRLIAHVPHGHWKTMTFIAALRINRIDAPWVIDGPINGDAFKTYVERELLQTLQPGDVVVLDNLGSHKGKAVRQMVRAKGAKLFFLPPFLADKAYDANALIEMLESRKITPVIPSKSNRVEPRDTDYALYRERNLVERFFNTIKHFRGIATRYDKLANTFLGAIHLIVAVIWLN